MEKTRKKADSRLQCLWKVFRPLAIYCRDNLQSPVLLSRSVPKQFELLLLKIQLSKYKSLTIAACCALDTICELIVPHLSSELVLLGDLNWNML